MQVSVVCSVQCVVCSVQCVVYSVFRLFVYFKIQRY